MKTVIPTAQVNAYRAKSGVRLGGLSGVRLRLARDFHAPMCDDDLLGS